MAYLHPLPPCPFSTCPGYLIPCIVLDSESPVADMPCAHRHDTPTSLCAPCARLPRRGQPLRSAPCDIIPGSRTSVSRKHLLDRMPIPVGHPPGVRGTSCGAYTRISRYIRRVATHPPLITSSPTFGGCLVLRFCMRTEIWCLCSPRLLSARPRPRQPHCTCVVTGFLFLV